MFAVFLKQRGYGCDYTIGCGMRLEELAAATIEDARKEATKLIKGNYSYIDYRLEVARIVEIVDEIDVATLYEAFDKKKAMKEETRKKQRRHEEYEKLKKEFE